MHPLPRAQPEARHVGLLHRLPASHSVTCCILHAYSGPQVEGGREVMGESSRHSSVTTTLALGPRPACPSAAPTDGIRSSCPSIKMYLAATCASVCQRLNHEPSQSRHGESRWERRTEPSRSSRTTGPETLGPAPVLSPTGTESVH